MVDRTVRPRADELVALRSAMRDVQLSTVSYYEATAGAHADADLLETPARATIAFIQKVNEVLTHKVGQHEKYVRIFERHLSEGIPGAELIEAFRYARHAEAHHLLSAPTDLSRLVGGTLGFLTSATWAPMSAQVHKALFAKTRALQPFFIRRMQGRDVVETFVEAAGYLASVCPMAVHRNARGDWTGFPLRSQPGVSMRLHPEEPRLDTLDRSALARHRRWLRNRRPGGDFRLVCGRRHVGGEDYLVGLTFLGNVSYSPFVELPADVDRDLSLGYPYLLPAESGTALAMRSTGELRHGGVMSFVTFEGGSRSELVGPISAASEVPMSVSVLADEEWAYEIWKANSDYLVRRAQRLAAFYPPA